MREASSTTRSGASDGCDTGRITKRSRQVCPVIDVQFAPTLASIDRIVTDAGGIAQVLLSDLSLGAWRPHQIAAEWAECLDMSPYPASWSDAQPSRARLSFGSVADAGIEMEALGERVVRDASALVERLADRLSGPDAPRLLLVIAPAHGKPWREENLVFLRFMLAALTGDRCRLRLLANHSGADPEETSCPFNAPPDMQLHWIATPAAVSNRRSEPQAGIGCLPGLVPASVAFAVEYGAGLVLRSGAVLPAPESRPAGAVAPSVYDRLRPLLSAAPWLDGFAEFAGSNFHVDVDRLARHATAAFDLGGTDIAIDYLTRAIGCARGPQRAGLQCQLQGYRIATHRFSDAADTDEAPPHLPAKLGAFLSMARGWGAVMSGRAAQGIVDLKRSAAWLDDDADDKFRAYLQNITALGLAQLGQPGEAMSYEQHIDATNIGPQRSWSLYYVNQINMARLYRRTGHHRDARRCYERAFASHWGGRSNSDRVYVNAVMARIAETEGQSAQLDWVRSGLHFAAALTPESFGARHASLVIGRQELPGSRERRVELVADALASKIAEGLSVAPGDLASGACPVFTECPPDPARTSGAVLIGGTGWSLVAETRPRDPVFDGASMRRLRRVLASWIAGAQQSDLAWVGTYYVDSRMGREMAVSAAECVETALRLHIDAIVSPSFNHRFDAQRRHDISGRCRLQLSELVSAHTHHGDFAEVQFKRCRRPVRLSDRFGILTAAERGDRIGDLSDSPGENDAHVFAELARFEEAGVVWRTLSVEDRDGLVAENGSTP